MTRTYGTVKHQNGKWIIVAEPHVMLRAKRVFAQVSKNAQGKLEISATAAATRDLQWFLERYPMVVDDPARLAELAQRHDSAMATVQGMLDRTTEPPTFDLAVPARAYQRVAASIVLGTGRLLLCDDVGLGKTCSAICVLSDQRARPAVVVTMTHLPAQWMAEINRFSPTLKVWSPRKASPQARDMEHLHGLLRPDVIVIGYSKLNGWAQTLVDVFGAKAVIFDEIQELRTGAGTGKGAAASLIAGACAFRMGLTATPVYNYGGEIRNVLEFIEPGCLGSPKEFAIEWAGYEGGDRIKDPKALGASLRERGLMLRRVGADVSDEVPELAKPIRIPHLVDADTEAIENGKSSAAEFARILLSDTTERGEKMRASGEIDWRLRQATGIAKATYVAAFVRMLLTSEPKVLLYGWHHAVYALWMEALAEFEPACFTGDESATEKEASKQAFVKGDSRVLVMSLRSGAGVDGLQGVCRCVVFGELDWSPGVHEQCIGRIHRPGQRDTVRAYFLHADDGSDPIVVEVLGIKQAQAQGIRDPLAASSEAAPDRTHGVRMLAESCLRATELVGAGDDR